MISGDQASTPYLVTKRVALEYGLNHLCESEEGFFFSVFSFLVCCFGGEGGRRREFQREVSFLSFFLFFLSCWSMILPLGYNVGCYLDLFDCAGREWLELGGTEGRKREG